MLEKHLKIRTGSLVPLVFFIIDSDSASETAHPITTTQDEEVALNPNDFKAGIPQPRGTFTHRFRRATTLTEDAGCISTYIDILDREGNPLYLVIIGYAYTVKKECDRAKRYFEDDSGEYRTNLKAFVILSLCGRKGY